MKRKKMAKVGKLVRKGLSEKNAMNMRQSKKHGRMGGR
jgi:hypothetical protein